MRGINAILTSALILAAGLSLISNATSFAAPAKASKTIAAKTSTAQTDDPIVVINTNKGPIKIQLFKSKTPITSGNFLDLVGRGFYNGTTFHRYEKGFVIQGGDPTGTGTGNFVDPKTKKSRHIKLEKVADLKHDCPGMVAMARTSDPDSASAQFYFTLAPATFLDDPPGYAVFGKVVEGMDVVMKLRKGDKISKATVEK